MTNPALDVSNASPPRDQPLLLVYTAIALIGCFVTLVTAYGYYLGNRLTTIDETLVDAAMEIKLEAAAALLVLNDHLKRNSSKTPEDVWQKTSRLLVYLEIGLASKGFIGGHSGRPEVDAIEAHVEAAKSKLTVLRKATDHYLVHNTEGLAGYNSLNQAYLNFGTAVDELGEHLIAFHARSLRRFHATQGFIIFSSILLFSAIGFFYHHFERQRSGNLAELYQYNRRLEKEMQERIQAEQALQRIHGQLEDTVKERTAALQSSNEELTDQIRQRRKIERHLRKSKAMLQGVFDGIREPLILVEADMTIKLMNQSAATYYGIDSADDVVGQLCRQVDSGRTDCDNCTIPQLVESGRSETFERPGLADPSRIEQITIYPLVENNRFMKEAIIRISDITEAKQLQQHVILSEKMASLGVLVSSIAHEVNNPNSLISFNIPILKEYLSYLFPLVDAYALERPDFELFHMPYQEFKTDLYKLLDNMAHGSKRISAFILNLREFSEARGNKQRKWASVQDIVDKAVDMCRNKLKPSILSFDMAIEGNIPQIYTEPVALEQILINLLINAAQAADKESSWVHLTVERESQASSDLVIKISDNGSGIEPSALKKIFDPFYTTKPLGEGTGLGLYVCQNIAKNLGVRIEVQSEVGVGSQFKLFIPINRSDAAQIGPQKEVA